MERTLEGILRERLYGASGAGLIGMASGALYAGFIPNPLPHQDIYFDAGLIASVIGGTIIGQGAGSYLAELQTKGIPLPSWLFCVLP